MNAEKQRTSTEELNGFVFKVVKLSSDRTINIIKKAQDRELREVLAKHLNDFEDIGGKLTVALLESGERAKEDNIINKIGSVLDTTLGTLINSETAKLAEVAIDGYASSKTELTRAIREYENTSCSEESLGFAREALKIYEDFTAQMKEFL